MNTNRENTKIQTSNTKVMTPRFWVLVFGVCVLSIGVLSVLSARADLSATVTPGYTFATGERPTTATLNLLANPTVTISGTIGGTNAGLAAKSVNGTHLADSVVDNVTVQYDSSSPRAIQVLTSGLAGPGLTGATAGGPLTNNVDGVTLVITNDFIALGSNLPPRYLLGSSNTVPMFYYTGLMTNMPVKQFYTNLVPQVTFSSSVACSSITAAGNYINTAHSLGTTPMLVRAVLVCTTANLNYAVGDEIDLAYPINNVSGVGYVHFGVPFANATNVGFSAIRTFADVELPNKTTGAASTPTAASWSLKVYARP